MEGDDSEAVELAVRRLLSATREFSKAYQAWAAAPRDRAPDRQSVLEDAERRLDMARTDVIVAQLRKH